MSEAFDRLLQRATDDARVVGVVVGGSRGKGLGTANSDWDVYVVVQSGDDVPRVRVALLAGASQDIDLCGVFTLAQFKGHAAVGDGQEWNRYNFAHLVPALDRTPGRLLQGLCDGKEWLPEPVATRRAGAALDAYLNSYYRTLKNGRDGNYVAASLDAAEAVSSLLQFVFTAERRVRPYNKFLAWGLTTHPLERQWWPTLDVMSLLLDVVRSSSLTSLAALFRHVEREARELGFGDIVDAWGGSATSAMRRGGASG